MDSKGHWHNTPAQTEIMRHLRSEITGLPERPVIEIGIGERVSIAKSDGSFVFATFDKAEKNRVTLTPCVDSPPAPYFEFAEAVELRRENGEKVKAQIWDNRGGRIIVRTLPV